MKEKKETYLEENIENAAEIRKRIHEETDYETKEIISRVKVLAKNLLNDAKLAADKNRTDSFLELEQKIGKIKERIFSALNLEKKRVIMGEKSKFIDEVFLEINIQAKAFRGQKEYDQFLKKIILEGIAVIATGSLEVFYSPLDEEIINDGFIEEAKKSCQGKLNQEIQLKFTKSDFNDIGFIVQSLDGRLIYDARFASRLKLAQDDIYMDLLRKL
ncbi:MAG: V-type ATP synthase subunit E [Candidatus Omnitrophica bacterium]|jgi:vacuolar-type H+-ATPase subunit E/Vma4|nr:V-type ATP synthase subunit E [Candidatus Omnitrophota bacterium]